MSVNNIRAGFTSQPESQAPVVPQTPNASRVARVVAPALKGLSGHNVFMTPLDLGQSLHDYVEEFDSFSLGPNCLKG